MTSFLPTRRGPHSLCSFAFRMGLHLVTISISCVGTGELLPHQLHLGKPTQRGEQQAACAGWQDQGQAGAIFAETESALSVASESPAMSLCLVGSPNSSFHNVSLQFPLSAFPLLLFLSGRLVWESPGWVVASTLSTVDTRPAHSEGCWSLQEVGAQGSTRKASCPVLAGNLLRVFCLLLHPLVSVGVLV